MDVMSFYRKGFLLLFFLQYALPSSWAETSVPLSSDNVVSWSVSDQSVVLRLNGKNQLLELHDRDLTGSYSLRSITPALIEFSGKPGSGEYFHFFTASGEMKRYSLVPGEDVSSYPPSNQSNQ